MLFPSSTLAGLLLATLLSAPAWAQTAVDHSSMGHAQASDMTDGEVRRINLESGKLTIKHAEIKNLDMPGMTMVFTAKDKAMLSKVKVGDKIKFTAVSESGQYWVTAIQIAD